MKKVSNATEPQVASENKREQLKMKILSATSFLLPLASSIPPFWGGIMTLPFLFYLIGLLGNLEVIFLIQVSDIIFFD